MKVDKMSVSFEADLGDAIRTAATRGEKPLSTWLAAAAAAHLRSEALDTFLQDWEAEHGQLSPTELAAAEMQLGFTTPKVA